ncbi:NUDIX domain-containing protein [Streptomyces sp. NPDC088729]|uniref:NUDIX hydrolase n=1 Tax=Streptomyces sp. NPDC088729 TaxID=3365876 RepID=UPI00380BD4CF
MSVLIDTVAWVRIEDGRILCARPRGKDVFYIPGGKREGTETDLETLLREVEEELTVSLIRETVVHAGTYEAPAHTEADTGVDTGVDADARGQDDADAAPVLVRMSCYYGDYRGTLAASSEIEEVAWFSFADRSLVPPVDQLLFDDLKAAGQLR